MLARCNRTGSLVGRHCRVWVPERPETTCDMVPLDFVHSTEKWRVCALRKDMQPLELKLEEVHSKSLLPRLVVLMLEKVIPVCYY
jgi:hypothetical protein